MPSTGTGSAPSEADRERARAALQMAHPKWRLPEQALDLDGIRWKPDLLQDSAALHISLTGSLPPTWCRRLKKAAEAGLSVTFVTGNVALEVEVLEQLLRIDAAVAHVDVSEGIEPRVHIYRSVADFIAEYRLVLDQTDLHTLVLSLLERSTETSVNAKKGRWFEEALSLVFGQVSWLTVDEHSYNNATEEIDLLLSSRAVGFIAQLVNGAFIVATAKNEKQATNSQTVKYLKEQAANRKGRCKLALLCSASTISEDARLEILRGAQSSDLVVACIDRQALNSLIHPAADLDHEFERLLRQAVAD